MSLRPDLEARVRLVEDQASEAAKKADAVCEAIDDSIDDDGCIPEEAFDDPSVVRHTIDLDRTGRRIRRESAEESGLIRKAR